MHWKEEESPLQFGIMFSETVNTPTETKWFDTEEVRDLAFSTLLETGRLELNSPLIRTQRTVEPYAFTTINAAPTFYKRV